MVLRCQQKTEKEAIEQLAGAVHEAISLAQDLGGSMEYCHGVGIRLAHLMRRELGHALDLMAKVKQAIDPGNILNPGKMALPIG